MVVFMQEPKYNSFGHAFYCMNRDIRFDDDDTQFVTLSLDYYNCEACSKADTCVVEESRSSLKATAEAKTEAEAEIKVESSLKTTGAANFLKTQNKAKTLKRFGTNMLKTFATISCLLSLVTYGIIGEQTRRENTAKAASEMIKYGSTEVYNGIHLITKCLDSQCEPNGHLFEYLTHA
eukprot:10214495-Karenia_brevis.AAC.1